ncbi:hypothetical protein RJ640_022023 [Escallonia rubra]|uniref:Uncharacterized protein n=1 Tax=Escallonia rubra TaxID=112253 RepID=A0AA88QZR6_9ASTE|nr:hypothetical protein RJ640_022023 [Escallonia rubra]
MVLLESWDCRVHGHISTVLNVMGVPESPNKCASLGVQGIAWAFALVLMHCVVSLVEVQGIKEQGMPRSHGNCLLTIRAVLVLLSVMSRKGFSQNKLEADIFARYMSHVPLEDSPK